MKNYLISIHTHIFVDPLGRWSIMNIHLKPTYGFRYFKSKNPKYHWQQLTRVFNVFGVFLNSNDHRTCILFPSEFTSATHAPQWYWWKNLNIDIWFVFFIKTFSQNYPTGNLIFRLLCSVNKYTCKHDFLFSWLWRINPYSLQLKSTFELVHNSLHTF